ncbi:MULTISPECIES: amino acid ABC transporter permease [unclassified Mesorhizobium]|uniref:amino acid ABC transporter permease n=1 Tax=unclassified Mesorhizobium TaxID=325217 RepID=UPI000F751E82|nr:MULTISPECIES: amino acid ABC transporter permease [unclassified Mesorhizobium]AZO52643.1 amino acid ABC transporter permease [Mesorhizobium sp. M8A.F.Ca.ET.057.01.1.1]RWE45520.1 MAG: amino acid ABC transporter permease [Mesorhizobium sp.]TJX68762.1 MAG: amino acid ABC transporter permease [Mesorhizobium sp.]
MSFDFSVIADNWQILAKGFGNTVLMCAVSLPLGFALGIVLALVRLRGGRVPAAVVSAYVELFRNIPFLIQIFLLFYALPMFGIRLSPVMVSIGALSAYAGAYSAEIIRGAIQSISHGQVEAGYALGLRYLTIFRKILVPQVLGYILPAATNLTITLIKESAILSAITVPELTYMAQNVIGRTFSPVEIFTAIALLYWGLTALVAAISRSLEHRLQPHLAARRGA